MIRKYDAEQIIKILKELQIKYNRPWAGSGPADKKKQVMEIVEKLMTKFDTLKMELSSQRKLMNTYLAKKSKNTIE